MIYCLHCFGRKDNTDTVDNLELKCISTKVKKRKASIYNLSFDLTCFSMFPMRMHVRCFELLDFALRMNCIFLACNFCFFVRFSSSLFSLVWLFLM